MLVLERVQLVDPAAREQRRVDLEVGVLGGGADEDDRAILDGRQQRVLLRLVEAVDLVQEEDRALTATSSARGSALPMSSLASTTIRRAMKRGSSPPSIMAAR